MTVFFIEVPVQVPRIVEHLSRMSRADEAHVGWPPIRWRLGRSRTHDGSRTHTGSSSSHTIWKKLLLVRNDNQTHAPEHLQCSIETRRKCVPLLFTQNSVFTLYSMLIQSIEHKYWDLVDVSIGHRHTTSRHMMQPRIDSCWTRITSFHLHNGWLNRSASIDISVPL